jgi:hypothetical protein
MIVANQTFDANLHFFKQNLYLFSWFATSNGCFNKNGHLLIEKTVRCMNGRPHSADWHRLMEFVEKQKIPRKTIVRGSQKNTCKTSTAIVNHGESVHIFYVNMKSYSF